MAVSAEVQEMHTVMSKKMAKIIWVICYAYYLLTEVCTYLNLEATVIYQIVMANVFIKCLLFHYRLYLPRVLYILI